MMGMGLSAVNILKQLSKTNNLSLKWKD